MSKEVNEMTHKQLVASITTRAVCNRCGIPLGIKGITAYKSKGQFYCEKCIRKNPKKAGK